MTQVAYIAMTLSWPGSWAKGKTVAAAKKALRQHMSRYEVGAKVRVFEVHPDTYIDEMANFVHPRGHPPKQLT